MDAALEELLNAGNHQSSAGAAGGPDVGDSNANANRATLSALGWHASVMGPLRPHENAGSRFRASADHQELNMNSSSSMPGDDVTSTTPPPATTSCLPPQLSPNNQSGMGNANGTGHPTNSIRGKCLCLRAAGQIFLQRARNTYSRRAPVRKTPGRNFASTPGKRERVFSKDEVR